MRQPSALSEDGKALSTSGEFGNILWSLMLKFPRIFLLSVIRFTTLVALFAAASASSIEKLCVMSIFISGLFFANT